MFPGEKCFNILNLYTTDEIRNDLIEEINQNKLIGKENKKFRRVFELY